MRKGVKFFLTVLMLVTSMIFVNTVTGKEYDPNNPIVIRVGVVYSNNILGAGGCSKLLFEEELEGYEWSVGSQNYTFELGQINSTLTPIGGYNSSLLYYDEINSSYDVIIFAGIQDEQIICGFPVICRFPNIYWKIPIIKDNLKRFVNEGGGFIGHCGGAVMPLNTLYQPRTVSELIADNLNFINTNIKMWTHSGFAILCEHGYLTRFLLPINWIGHVPYPEWIGAFSNYQYCKYPFSGIPMHLNIRDKNHPILQDCLDDQLFFKLSGGPALIVPFDDPDISNLADFRWQEDPCINTSTRFNAWSFNVSYVPKLEEMIELLSGESSESDSIYEIFETWNSIMEEWQMLPDWDYTNIPIKTEHANRSGLVAFYYGENGVGDETGGRMVLCTLHPEIDLWKREGNYVLPANETDNNRLYTGEEPLIKWVNKTGPGEDDWRLLNEDDLIQDPNCWFIRREAAWASGLVPDEHLPPVYGRSQVVDINPILQEPPEFTLNCTVGKENGETWTIENLSLFYRFSDLNSTQNWTNWIYYDSIDGFPYKFTFNASKANGCGMYQFCTLFNTSDGERQRVEEFPPGADAECVVQDNIVADFRHNPGTGYVNHTVYFYSEAVTAENSYITSYEWDFGDGSSPQQGPDENTTHTFEEDGIYNVTHTVTNNLSQNDSIIKQIIVLNVPPIPDFSTSNWNVVVGENVQFTDTSNDPDGSIVNWSWNFGDYTTSYDQNPSHAYEESGWYPVTLEVRDDDGMTNSTCKVACIRVSNGFVDESYQTNDPLNFTWNNIRDALDNSSTFDIIFVKNGTYSENIIVNKSVLLIGEDQNGVTIDGSVTMVDPHDYELPNNGEYDGVINMSGNVLLMHFNNDSDVGEDYGSSDVVYDYSGQENNGNKYGATWNTDTLKGNGCFDFDGSNDQINLSSISALSGENVTVSAWVYWTWASVGIGGGSRVSDPIASQSNNSSGGYCLHIKSSTSKPAFRLNGTEVISSVTVSKNEWHHIVGTHNETTLKIYVDGALQGNASKNGTGLDTVGFIGFDNMSHYFKGMIEEIAVWNRTLTSDEIRTMYDRNYGASLNWFTINNASIGITPSNFSEVRHCLFVNNTVGAVLNCSVDVVIEECNFTDGTIGIKVLNSNPDENSSIVIVDCNIENITDGIIVNSSSNISFIRVTINCSGTNLTFNNCDFITIHVLSSTTPDNVAPDAPSLSGPSLGEINTSYTYYSCTNDSNDDQILYWFDWGDDNNSGWLNLYWSNVTVNASHSWTQQGGYYVRVKAKDVFNNESNWTSILFRTETLPPLINSVNDIPDTIGFGGIINITTNVTDDTSGNSSGIKTVKINITYPDSSYVNSSMVDMGDNIYRYLFSDSWVVGQYNYTIWAQDNAYNANTSTGHSFNVSAQANMTIATLKDSYGSNEYINLTDPPNSGPSIGYALNSSDNTLHIWNPYDNYYFNTTNGIQLTNHKDDYWTHNILMLGYYNNDKWNLIYRADELSGFNKEIDSNNQTYVNATLWKDLTYQGYDFRLAIRYHLGINDTDLTIIPYIKNLDDDDIPYTLGFGWEIKDIQIAMTEENDWIDINGTSYLLHTTTGINQTYTALDQPSTYIREYMENGTVEELYLKWNSSLTYKVQVKSRENQYNAPVTLFIRIGTLASGQEKQTEMYWHDGGANPYKTYYFNGYDLFGEKWLVTPQYMVDGSTSTCAETPVNNDVEDCISNSCSGIDYGIIDKVELRVLGKYATTPTNIILTPEFGGTSDGDDYTFSATTTKQWSSYFDITDDASAPGNWDWDDVDDLDCHVKAVPLVEDSFTAYCYKVEIRVTYTEYKAPTVTNPNPSNGSTGIITTPELSVTVDDDNDDTLTAYWYSNSSGSWALFATNESISTAGGAQTIRQTNSNFSALATTYYWSVNVTDDRDWTNKTYHFQTRYQSKINNTGSTNISGYLLIQVQYNDSGNWIVDNDTVNETTPRTINSSSQLGLDTIFNGLVNTNDLTNSNGTYRVYATFRDPDGNILQCDDDIYLVATWEFTVTFS